MIYADVDGNIGWIAAGLMPRRRWSGLLPVPGDGRLRVERIRPDRAAAAIVQSRERIHRDGEQQHSAARLQDADRVRLVVATIACRASGKSCEPERLHRRRLSGAAARRPLGPRASPRAARSLAPRGDSGRAIRRPCRCSRRWNYRHVARRGRARCCSRRGRRSSRAARTPRDSPAEAAQVMGNRADYEQLEAFLAAPAGAVSARFRDSLMRRRARRGGQRR